eukprot:scaffold10651_cov112-Isochrysis_galbana.AAC.4
MLCAACTSPRYVMSRRGQTTGAAPGPRPTQPDTPLDAPPRGGSAAPTAATRLSEAPAPGAPAAGAARCCVCNLVFTTSRGFVNAAAAAPEPAPAAKYATEYGSPPGLRSCRSASLDVPMMSA